MVCSFVQVSEPPKVHATNPIGALAFGGITCCILFSHGLIRNYLTTLYMTKQELVSQTVFSQHVAWRSADTQLSDSSGKLTQSEGYGHQARADQARPQLPTPRGCGSVGASARPRGLVKLSNHRTLSYQNDSHSNAECR
jgi:hypothetical protein